VGRFAVRGLLSRKLRTALTAIAIVLGVAMISGTFVLTDSIDQAFDSIFTDIRKGSNAVISGKSAFDLGDQTGVSAPTLSESLLPEVRALPDVAEAEGSVVSDATQLIGDDGKAVVSGGAPNLGFSIANGDSVFNPLTLVEGDWPGPNEVAIDKETAAKEDFEVGETIGVQAEGPVERVRVSAIVQFSSGLTVGGPTLGGLDPPRSVRRGRRNAPVGRDVRLVGTVQPEWSAQFALRVPRGFARGPCVPPPRAGAPGGRRGGGGGGGGGRRRRAGRRGVGGGGRGGFGRRGRRGRRRRRGAIRVVRGGRGARGFRSVRWRCWRTEESWAGEHSRP